ncbi:hypothetical protein KIL84_000852 [Mauremys mutica]|uniref:Uncharacterized protein n=1 Tax=Mauremys mutica TaxID=74926 RepID=A0A9D3WXF9_9SAUR|nr:hypothetical protein KIL84_000852 [Mauremys mutica]
MNLVFMGCWIDSPEDQSCLNRTESGSSSLIALTISILAMCATNKGANFNGFRDACLLGIRVKLLHSFHIGYSGDSNFQLFLVKDTLYPVTNPLNHLVLLL